MLPCLYPKSVHLDPSNSFLFRLATTTMFASLFALLPLIPAASALVIPRQDTSNTTESSQLIHPGSDTSLCLTVAAGYAAQGTSVGVAPCFGSGGSFSGLQNWVIERGETQVQLAGTNWCLDFGDEPK